MNHSIDTLLQYYHYRHPHPLYRQWQGSLLRFGIVLAGFGCIAQLGMALWKMPLFFGTALFTVILLGILLLGSVLHPELRLTAQTITLYPLIAQAQTITWEQVRGVAEHPLLFNDPAAGRKLHGQRYIPRLGMVVILDKHTAVLPWYRLVGLVTGIGWRPAFAISNTTHTEYLILAQQVLTYLSTDAPTGALTMRDPF